MKWELYTDGACQPNPGFGGWAFILKNQIEAFEVSGFEPETTNNRMEMIAVIKGLEYFLELNNSEELLLYSDSQYLINGITTWMHSWSQNNWKKKTGDKILNPDLWQILYNLVPKIKLECHHIKGHNNHFWNEKVDKCAVSAILINKKKVNNG